MIAYDPELYQVELRKKVPGLTLAYKHDTIG